ncbi:MAG: ISNCY family transposase, partial [Candidatus Eremiobacteraeota bacterium]|nr:ISNCY family transposase [Candidatus Eremiobacteraeota bacterium]
METLLVAKRDLVIARTLDRLIDGRTTTDIAARTLGKSSRQIRRLRRRYERSGIAGLRSAHIGRPAANRLDSAQTARAIEIVAHLYRDFGPTLANEKLREHHGINLCTESLRKLMIAEGLWKHRARKRNVHQPRARRPYYGELVQIDGSPHDWFEGRRPRCTLLVAIDDATSGYMSLLFAEQETTAGYFELVSQYIGLHGKPLAFYSDKHAIFRHHLKSSQIADLRTQFARAMNELDIELICANTPQAKGRVERANATLQDRLVKELRLRNIDSIAAANAFLANYRLDLNRRFQRQPQCAGNAHRQLNASEQLEAILIHVEERTLSKNLTFQFGSTLYRVLNEPNLAPGQRVRVQRSVNGNICVDRGGRTLAHQFVREQTNTRIADRTTISEPANLRIPNPKKGHKPAPDHPWSMHTRSDADPDILAWETPD